VERSASFKKPINTKKNQQKHGGFTNKNLFFHVRVGFYWFLNDAERYSSIYVNIVKPATVGSRCRAYP